MRGNLQTLQRALQFSKAIHRAARQGDWDGVTALETERRPVIRSAFEGDAVIEDALAERLITGILELDRQVMAWAVAARSAATDELSNLHRGRRVVNAYRAVAR